MPATRARPDWDIFCRVIDNFGDIGVCWRLARQLAGERRLRVRLWVDRLDTFSALCPQVHPGLPRQECQGVEIRAWRPSMETPTPARCVLETFACHLPEAFVDAMASQAPPPVWINLDYLSAEKWVPNWHLLPSPHPRLALTKFYFFPGFGRQTGGVLRERKLIARRQTFHRSAGRQDAFWRRAGNAPPPPGSLLISLFAYDNPALGDLLAHWATARTPLCCLVPRTRALSEIEAFAGRSLATGDVVRRGALEIRVLPFLEQDVYDQLLWVCDLNFVRGEDSFVRAQWAARPLVWHIYPQQDGAHLVKLDAFLDTYCNGLPRADAGILREFWHGWNTGHVQLAQWQAFAGGLTRLRRHAWQWQHALAKQDDLSTRLLRFARSKL